MITNIYVCIPSTMVLVLRCCVRQAINTVIMSGSRVFVAWKSHAGASFDTVLVKWCTLRQIFLLDRPNKLLWTERNVGDS